MSPRYISADWISSFFVIIISSFAFVSVDFPVTVKSVQGDKHTAAAGRTTPSLRNLIKVDNANPPPAESPAMIIFFGLIPF